MNRTGLIVCGMVGLIMSGLAQADPIAQSDIVMPATPFLTPESPIQQPIAPVVPTPPPQPNKPPEAQPSAEPATLETKPPAVSEISQRKIRDTLRKLDDLLMRR